MPKTGVRFDIDGLGGGFYGAAAYTLPFDAADRATPREVRSFEGDTNATLAGDARIYCIAVESRNERVCDHTRRSE
jgi:hypothetical protein